jgi:hypothetical protein
VCTVGQANFARKRRPVPITLVALFQFFKAGYLLFIFWEAWMAHLSWTARELPAEDPFVQQLIKDPLFLLLPLVAIGSIAFGWGLWQLQKWARNYLMFLIAFGWAEGGFSFNNYLFGGNLIMPVWQRRTTLCVFLLDLFVFCCLAFYPEVGKAFGERD